MPKPPSAVSVGVGPTGAEGVKVATRARTATITHPNDASVSFTLRRIGRIEAIRFGARLKDNDAIDTIRGTLGLCVVGWSGLQDEDGNVINFSKDSIDYLIDDSGIDCKQIEWEVDVPDEPQVPTKNPDGTFAPIKTHKETKVVDVPLWEFLAKKAADPATFDSDPLASGSAQQPSGA